MGGNTWARESWKDTWARERMGKITYMGERELERYVREREREGGGGEDNLHGRESG